MQHCTVVVEQRSMFKDAVTTAAEEKIGRKRGSKREDWIQDRTCILIDEQNKAKQWSSIMNDIKSWIKQSKQVVLKIKINDLNKKVNKHKILYAEMILKLSTVLWEI